MGSIRIKTTDQCILCECISADFIDYFSLPPYRVFFLRLRSTQTRVLHLFTVAGLRRSSALQASTILSKKPKKTRLPENKPQKTKIVFSKQIVDVGRKSILQLLEKNTVTIVGVISTGLMLSMQFDQAKASIDKEESLRLPLTTMSNTFGFELPPVGSSISKVGIRRSVKLNQDASEALNGATVSSPKLYTLEEGTQGLMYRGSTEQTLANGQLNARYQLNN